MPTTVCTIISKNYRHFARTLMDSIAEHHPEWRRVVLLVDRLDGAFDPTQESFEVIEVESLDVPDRWAMFFRYDIMELNTAMKPWVLKHLFIRDESASSVIYFDPDIRLYSPLTELRLLLEEGGATCVLTPHLTGCLDDAHKPTELDIRRSGTYNLGFIALNRGGECLRLLDWWCEKSRRDFVVDFESGRFTDQSWIDLVPGMFDGVRILRHEGYNTAYWNLPHRTPSGTASACLFNDQPLRFFHFSGLNPSSPMPFSKHQDRYTLLTLPSPVGALTREYCRLVIENGLETSRAWPYAYGRLHDGTPIIPAMRRLVDDGTIAHATGDPFQLTALDFLGPRHGSGRLHLPPIVHFYWRLRPDLQQAYPDPFKTHLKGLLNWFVQSAPLEHDVPSVLVDAIRPLLDGPGRPTMMQRAKHAMYRRAQPWRMLLPPGVRQWGKRFLLGESASTVNYQRQIADLTGEDGGASGSQGTGSLLPQSPEERASGCGWVTGAVCYPLPDDLVGDITITLEFHPALASGVEAPVVRLHLDDRFLCEHPLIESGRQRIVTPLERDPEGATRFLHVGANFAASPKSLGLSDDGRILSFPLCSIAVDDETIVDCSQSKHYRLDPERLLTLGLNVVGFVRSELGLGQSVRDVMRSAQCVALPVHARDISELSRNRAEDRSCDHLLKPLREAFPNVIAVNADFLPQAMSVVRDELGDRYNIGIWYWELPEFPDRWIDAFRLVDEVWAPTTFIRESLSDKASVPVVLMPPPLAFDRPAGPDPERFGMDSQRFWFLCMYDMHSYQERKNPQAAIDAYLHAFPTPGPAGLVIKAMNTDANPKAWSDLEALVGDRPDIMFINRMLSRADVYLLEASAGAYVSLHRSEGFGLGLAESMYLGKPVVGTNWSGNTDFMNEQNSCPVRYAITELTETHGPYDAGQHWAEADIEHAAEYMRRLIDDHGYARDIGEAARASIEAQYHPERIGGLMRRRLHYIARSRLGADGI